jgi:transcription elongation factor Elf1
MKITNYLTLYSNGNKIDSDVHGNNMAFSCITCGHPILVIALKNQRGFDEEHSAECKGCSARYFINISENYEKLYVHKLE